MTGRVRDPAAAELSGLVLSRSQPGVLWTHNDSGDGPRVLALAPSGRLLAEVTVSGAANVDWEDIATGPGDALYVGDIGDNEAQRPEVVVYRVPEPRLARGAASTTTAPAERFGLRYPDGARDAEALLVDPASGALVIVSKDLSGSARIYAAERPAPGTTTTLRRVGRVALGNALEVTGGDVSADGRTVAIRTYDRVFLWRRRRGQSLVSAMRRPPCNGRADLLVEGQGEAIALTPDGRAFYTVPEGRDPPLRRWAPPRGSRR